MALTWSGPRPVCHGLPGRQRPAQERSSGLWTNHLGSSSAGEPRSDVIRRAGSRRAGCVRRSFEGQYPLITLCQSKTTGDMRRSDVERSWTGRLEGTSGRIAPSPIRRAVQDRRVPSSRPTEQHSSRRTHPSSGRRAWLFHCSEGGLHEAPWRGVTTLEGVPDEDALSSKSRSRVGVPATPLVRKEARSRMALSSALAT